MTIDPVFIDTNILIYVRDGRNVEKRTRAQIWLHAIAASNRARTNLQVLNELTRWILNNEPSRRLRDVQAEIDQIGGWGARPIDRDDTQLAWLVRETFGYPWFDCLLVAAAHLTGCRYVLTEDMAHGAEFEGMTLINPFRALPGDLIQRN